MGRVVLQDDPPKLFRPDLAIFRSDGAHFPEHWGHVRAVSPICSGLSGRIGHATARILSGNIPFVREFLICPEIFDSRTYRNRTDFERKTLIAPYEMVPYSSAGPQNSAIRQAGADPKVEVLVCFRVGSEGSGKQWRPDAVRSRQPRARTMVCPGFQAVAG
jgi:hypothetical protein